MAVNFGQNEINCVISDCKSNIKGTIYDFSILLQLLENEMFEGTKPH